MANGPHILTKFAKPIAFLLFALAQLVPPGLAIASDDDGFQIVICSADGEKIVDWEEFTGEPSPFETHPETSDASPCHACMSSCRAGAGLGAASDGFFHPAERAVASNDVTVVRTPLFHHTGSPKPSRAPPQRAA